MEKFEVLKRAIKWTFSKGVSPWILSKNRTFSFSCFSRKLRHKKSPLNILNKKQSFSDQKMEVLTTAKNGQFPKGLVHGFCPKIEISRMGVLYRNCLKKWFLVILDCKNKKLKF